MPGGTVMVSHVLRRHQLSAIQSDAGWGAAASVARTVAEERIARRGGPATDIKASLAGAGVDLVRDGLYLRPLDRRMEHEADRIGVVIAARAGHDPYGLVSVLGMLAQLKPEEAAASLSRSTHPSASERLDELERAVPSILDAHAGQPRVESRFRVATPKSCP